MDKEKLLLLFALIGAFLLILSAAVQSKALEVKQTQTSVTSSLKVVGGSSEITNGKVVLQPTYNPQQ